MPPQLNGRKNTDVDWKNGLDMPDAPKVARDMETYPASILGDLGFRFRELFARDSHYPRPTSGQLAQTALLVGQFSRELSHIPLHRRTPSELELINYLVTPRLVWEAAQPFHQAVKQIIGESFLQSSKIITSMFRDGWTHARASESLYFLQQIALNLETTEEFYKQITKIVDAAIPSRSKYNVFPVHAGGAFALISFSGQMGNNKASDLLYFAGLDTLCDAESIPGLHVVEPLSRPTEFRFSSFFLADLLTAQCHAQARKTPGTYIPTEEEALDITRAWLEGSHYPIFNYMKHSIAMRNPIVGRNFGSLYHNNGIRNFTRLELSECEQPWFLLQHLAERAPDETVGNDIILVAISSSDHNDAYRERSWEFEGIRQAGELHGWAFDYVEVRDPSELAYHLLRHKNQGSQVSVLHHLGHGSREGAEFGNLERDNRPELNRSELFTQRDQKELCSIAQEVVGTWVLHHCCTAADTPGETRRITNLADALYKATHQQVTIQGLRGQDAFDALTHRRTADNRVIFTGKPVWYGARTLRSNKETQRISNCIR